MVSIANTYLIPLDLNNLIDQQEATITVNERKVYDDDGDFVLTVVLWSAILKHKLAETHTKNINQLNSNKEIVITKDSIIVIVVSNDAYNFRPNFGTNLIDYSVNDKIIKS